MDVGILIEPHLDLPRLARVLDELGPEGRQHAIYQWKRAHLAKLYEAGGTASLAQLVPEDTAPLTTVIHHGKNSLPLASHFQKRFCRAPASSESSNTLWGYNAQPFATFTGPGFFTAHASDGEVIFDYRELPERGAEGWPAVIPNTARLGSLVYANMVDRVRGVGTHVVVGRAFRASGRSLAAMDTWFALTIGCTGGSPAP